MSKEINKFETAGQIQASERGLRVFIGGAAIVAAVTGALPDSSQIFAAALFSIYAGLTAITGLDPVYAMGQKLASGLGRKTRGGLHFGHG